MIRTTGDRRSSEGKKSTKGLERGRGVLWRRNKDKVWHVCMVSEGKTKQTETPVAPLLFCPANHRLGTGWTWEQSLRSSTRVLWWTLTGFRKPCLWFAGRRCLSDRAGRNPRDSQFPSTHFQDHYNCRTGFHAWGPALGIAVFSHLWLHTVAQGAQAIGWRERAGTGYGRPPSCPLHSFHFLCPKVKKRKKGRCRDGQWLAPGDELDGGEGEAAHPSAGARSKALCGEGTQGGLYFLQSCQVCLRALIPGGKLCNDFSYLAFLGCERVWRGLGASRENRSTLWNYRSFLSRITNYCISPGVFCSHQL